MPDKLKVLEGKLKQMLDENNEVLIALMEKKIKEHKEKKAKESVVDPDDEVKEDDDSIESFLS